jgi:uncharacterized protein YodC (DUF2158 family)
MEWKVGDVVQLKTGGPQMTVQSVDHVLDKSITCSWFDKANKLQNAAFAAESLVKPEDMPKIEISFAKPKETS